MPYREDFFPPKSRDHDSETSEESPLGVTCENTNNQTQKILQDPGAQPCFSLLDHQPLALIPSRYCGSVVERTWD